MGWYSHRNHSEITALLERTVEIRYSGMKGVYKTKSFRGQNSGTRLYLIEQGDEEGGADRERPQRHAHVLDLHDAQPS
jgi:hypothetical protein